jgi:diadenosine tetraphosphatase ApaH/serine/threonine PP2A family protein phosphatase
MSRIAVVSDLHANLPAVQAVAEDIAGQDVHETWCLGDVVGYGGSPREVLDWVGKHAIVTVKGNHDHAVATGDVDGFNPVAAAAARNHAQTLTPPERTILDDLPLHVQRPMRRDAGAHPPGSESGGPSATALLVHASPDDPLREYVYPSSARRDLGRWRGRADVILLGHTHVPFLATVGPGPTPAWRAEGFEQAIFAEDDAPVLTILNPGSVGQPRDGDPRAAYAVLDLQERRIELRRVPYDVDAAAAAIRAARLDVFLAQRLYRGI